MKTRKTFGAAPPRARRRERHAPGSWTRVDPKGAIGGVLQDDLLEQLDQLVGKLGGHERLHRHRNLLRVFGLGQRRGHHLQRHSPVTVRSQFSRSCSPLAVHSQSARSPLAVHSQSKLRAQAAPGALSGEA
eukprot:1163391-Prorocentrum_minimum.AAC.3